MPYIRMGSNFFSLQHFIAPVLDLLPCLQPRDMRDFKKGHSKLQVLLENNIVLLIRKHELFGII